MITTQSNGCRLVCASWTPTPYNAGSSAAASLGLLQAPDLEPIVEARGPVAFYDGTPEDQNAAACRFLTEAGCSVTHIGRLAAPTAAVPFPKQDAGEPSVTCVHGSLCDLPCPANSFAAFVCLDSLSHVPDPQRVLQEVHRTLMPQGLVLLNVLSPHDATLGQSRPIHHKPLSVFLYGKVLFVYYEDRDFLELVRPLFAIVVRRPAVWEHQSHFPQRPQPHCHCGFVYTLRKR